ncbi:MAG: tRNA (adenosine(37)-N6)-threonylcarbamoyltransferase complex dimerization subunit type 1 TsaB [Alphaproteobacteria bacterium]|nr:tRNA (adenosine(37)-N6)-threonylcarbamoyltransferase complex dimerization subunit type 1 TsaB [Alphaproteobacteria bacterium]MBP7758930.1 tRNA (adenosine(37)-N6)-threonylcarbamoyltransferase complex dimerization subunit type 1 TsaB [Alphaproteobacteria bacterium]MBP7762205.1 tRNA (adenosine(37)-N6)-threonylcarbamoyltransferase complex dimerization subunit type 1 TsaB [Alphaproteobacteria bacterium]MBP7905798.1 tRNA (adenosine(37)-N6)-threonylcarbamoyltransferase complex dimerization subunit t
MNQALAKPLILSIDSALSGCAIGLLNSKDDIPLAGLSREMSSGQAEHLVPMIEVVLAAAGRQYGEIGLIAVVNGPGAFTGIRIGIAAAKALGLALEIPVIGVGTFETILHTALQREENRGYARYLVLLETKRTDFYVQQFDAQGNTITHGQCASSEAIRDELSTERTLLLGDAVERIQKEWGTNPATIAAREITLADPIITAKRAKELFQQKKNFTEIQPVYLRAPDVTMPKMAKSREK